MSMLLVICASILGASVAIRNPTQCTESAKKIIVGGTNWTFGFDYTNWASKNGPFYVNDILGKLSFFIFFYIDQTDQPINA